jgi:hypothetical protein
MGPSPSPPHNPIRGLPDKHTHEQVGDNKSVKNDSNPLVRLCVGEYDWNEGGPNGFHGHPGRSDRLLPTACIDGWPIFNWNRFQQRLVNEVIKSMSNHQSNGTHLTDENPSTTSDANRKRAICRRCMVFKVAKKGWIVSHAHDGRFHVEFRTMGFTIDCLNARVRRRCSGGC